MSKVTKVIVGNTDHAGAYSGSLLIVGCSAGVKDDLAIAPETGSVMGVSSAGIHLPRLDHWFSLHAAVLVAEHRLRLTIAHTRRIRGSWVLHSCERGPNIAVWNLQPLYMSGMAAPVVACAMGYEEIILAGIPGDFSGDFRPGQKPANFENDEAWEGMRDEVFEGRVKSLSGRTADILGRP